MGSDYPFPLGELYPPGGLIDKSNQSADIKEKLLYSNGMKFLGCDVWFTVTCGFILFNSLLLLFATDRFSP